MNTCLDPTGFYLRKYLPRVAGVFEPFKDFPDYPAIFFTRVLHTLSAYAAPEMVDTLRRLSEAGAEIQTMLDKAWAFVAEMDERGFPLAYAASTGAPFDLFADYLRGSKGAMLDMLRRKDKLLAAIDRAADFLPRYAIKAAHRQP